ncbi:MAG: hypothetical protein RLY31_2941 [Bacteroidota bacterium]|jgi:two-component system alkaline phosphatase synthesis response regulator PhoP
MDFKKPGPVKILLVDDEPDVLDFLGYSLRKEGFTLLTATGGKEAIRKAIRECPDMIILDVMMPECDGIRVCHRLRHCVRTQDAVILLLTAGSLPFARHAVELSGADGFLRKPVRPTDFLSHVKGQLGRFALATSEERSLLVQDDIIMNRHSGEVIIAQRCIRLKSEEFDLLWLLAIQRGQLVTNATIHQKLGFTRDEAAQRLRKIIFRLQEKIGSPFIRPVSGRGYRFVTGRTA